jgi:molybdopterin/thiamine biosynthesis adenylyltransferase
VNLGDGDRVRISDLNRQILYREEDIRKEKVLLAKKRLSEMHGEVTFKTFDIYIK